MDFHDYLWVEDFGWFTSDGYSLALIEASTAEMALAGLGASDDKIVRPGAQTAIQDAYDLGERLGVNGVDTQLIAAADLEGWAILLQAPGFIPISPGPMKAIVAERNAVAHGADRFVWWSGGNERISFEPLLPRSDLLGVLADRQPADAREEIISLIVEVGGIDLDENPDREIHHVAGSFALAERLTGVRVTEQFLREAEFTVAAVEVGVGL
ncbi:DUF6461 domain-containing protein [Williamsia sp. CHRR-6]|uniref:DUF6461 domain-containing protein n=1 Tax=Williamsia sp. CHRR-6 TaxID=2835871 RepID=UPI001BDA0B2F|nr:DUF6461 domain-containing protein [Williamsia sp. CHRR-6]MBT0568642.1 hypothetical protein [Williamsia sp. CHRR-6]